MKTTVLKCLLFRNYWKDSYISGKKKKNGDKKRVKVIRMENELKGNLFGLLALNQ